MTHPRDYERLNRAFFVEKAIFKIPATEEGAVFMNFFYGKADGIASKV